MKCLSRSTLGIVIGAVNICCFTVLIIYLIAILCDVSSLSEEEKQEYSEILTTSVTLLYIILIICIISLLTSTFLILGIIKQRHTFMKPWICSAIIGIAFYILRFIILIGVRIIAGTSFGSLLSAILVGLLTLGVQILIFYPIYTLYTDIRDAAANVPEQTGLYNYPQSPPTYGELEKGGEEMYH